MSHWSNLLPTKNQLSFEYVRQVKVWSAAWLAVSLVIVTLYGVLDRQGKYLIDSVANAEASVAPVREAEDTLVRLKTEKQKLKQLSFTADSLQHTDAPLALLQAVGTSCQDLGKKVQIDSFRMDEIGISSSVVGHVPSPRKQLLLVGSAEEDFLITAFVNRLSACGVFRKVELESSHAVADSLATKRTFQIHCQQ